MVETDFLALQSMDVLGGTLELSIKVVVFCKDALL